LRRRVHMRKVFWYLASVLIMALLLLVSCGPAAPTTTPPATTPPTTIPLTTPPTTIAAQEKPKYGGTINAIQNTDIISFDAGFSGSGSVTLRLTNESMLHGDWARGAAGTGEVDWIYGHHGVEYYTGSLAESWEVPEVGTLVFHIRKGVHYGLNPASEASRLVNGREFTGDDAYFNFKRYSTDPRSNMLVTQRAMAATTVVTQPDKWTVVVKTPADPWTGFLFFGTGFASQILLPEVIQKYGNMQDWRVSVGTGPFMMTDFVQGSQATLVRNPNYWDKDPVGPGKGNQLPYIDKVNLLIIPDVSSRLAAIRTARADWVTAVEWEDGAGLIKGNPKLQYKQYLPDTPYVIGMRTDKPDLPFKDKRVRQALMLATDFEAIKKDFYGGQAEILIWPIIKAKGFEKAYVPMEKQPEAVRALYSYNPTKAKQLLADAGYPNGFKAKVICQSIVAQVDPLSAIKAMWAKVGVDLELQPKEYAVWISIQQSRAHEEMLVRPGAGIYGYANMINFRGGSYFNVSYVNDPHIEEVYAEMQRNVLINQDKADQIHGDLMPYLLEQAYVVPWPTPYSYTIWWPWIKNYHGETIIGHSAGNVSWLTWAWVDQDLKEAMTGRR
jgi:peptide/nickel transport system substrate-binding protein